ncbi:MAG: cobalt-precorrin-6A reductase [Acidocella sp.]|nr:cobalt-precorrin-6A reductase [Acidocella sp.]
MNEQDTAPCVLLLGGTTEASRMARALAGAGVAGVFSYAGRTDTPLPQPMPTRIGGFGGVEGLADYLRAEAVTHVIDATHPFAVQMSRNAVTACTQTGIPLLALERPPWVPQAGDDWQNLPSQEAALAALPMAPARVFLAIGKQGVAAFAARPEHHYLLRLVDPPAAPPPLPNAEIVLARGPFTLADDLALLRGYGIELIIAKNAGGEGARAKLDAARALGLRVLMIERPTPPTRQVAANVEDALSWLAHSARLGV